MSLIIRLRGGLGNQMFQYAFASRLAYEHSENLILDDFSGFLNDKEYKRSFKLNFFSIKTKKIFENRIFSCIYLIKFKFFFILNKRLSLNTSNYFDDEKSIIDIKINKKRNLYLNGLWQNFEYFDDIKFKISNEFVLKKKYRINILNTYSDFNADNSVAVHIRNYDKIQKQKKNNLPQLYYKRAFEYFAKKMINPKFYIFSDDIFYANSLLKNFKYDLTINNNETFVNQEIVDFNLMSQFKNFIVANSTFSWWPAYLSNCNDKIIIYPNKKFKDYNKKWEFDLKVPNDWILI